MALSAEIVVFFIARTVLGALFLFQGYDKIFVVKPQGVFYSVSEQARKKNIPDWFSWASIYLSSYIEFIGGLMLLLGLLTSPVLFVLGLHLVIVSISFGFLNGLWDTRYFFPRLALLLALLLFPSEWNVWSIDHFLH